MKRINPSALPVTGYRVIEPDTAPHHRTAPDRGIIAAFCGLVWLLLLVGSVAYLGSGAVHLLQQGGQSNVTR